MFKNFLVCLSYCFICVICVYAQQGESLIITTYYPSPYGSYNELQTNRLAVGDTDQPNRNGDIRLKAQTGNPTFWPAGTVGQFSYSSDQDSLYHYNGSTWVASGGGSICMVTYNSNVGSCSCPSGWTLKYDLGPWGGCYSHGTGWAYYFSRPPGGGCTSGWYSYNIGEGCLCCQ
jgi:hypothetical protein